MRSLSTEITGKIRSAVFLLAALEEQGPEIAQLVLDKYSTSPDDGLESPDLSSQLVTFGQILQTSLDRMVELDQKLYDEDEQRAVLIEERDRLTGVLGKQITGVRRIVTGHYAEANVSRLGLVGRTERDPIALIRQTELICQRLRRENLEELLGAPLFDPTFDPRLCVPHIEPGVDSLRQAFEAHQKARRRVDELLAEKKSAVEEYDLAFIRVARQFEDLCRMAGQDDLAAKVRPSLTRRGETAIPPEESDTETETSAAEGTAASEPSTGDSPSSEAEPSPASPATTLESTS